MRSIAGVNIEDKGITVTIHYRLTPNPQAVEREILNAATDLNQANNFRVICGKMTINLLPPIEIDKGTATLGLIQESQLQGASIWVMT